jgi:hypothetical protein
MSIMKSWPKDTRSSCIIGESFKTIEECTKMLNTTCLKTMKFDYRF